MNVNQTSSLSKTISSGSLSSSKTKTVVPRTTRALYQVPELDDQPGRENEHSWDTSDSSSLDEGIYSAFEIDLIKSNARKYKYYKFK